MAINRLPVVCLVSSLATLEAGLVVGVIRLYADAVDLPAMGAITLRVRDRGASVARIVPLKRQISAVCKSRDQPAVQQEMNYKRAPTREEN